MQQSNELQSVAGLTGEPRHISAAGVTRTGQRIITLENTSPFDPSTTARRRVVVVADNDRAVLTHFIDGLEPAGPSQIRCANLPPTGRASQKPAKAVRISARERVFRSPGTAREPVSMAMGGVSGARPRASDSRRRRHVTQHAAGWHAGGSDGGGIGNWDGACRLWVGA